MRIRRTAVMAGLTLAIAATAALASVGTSPAASTKKSASLTTVNMVKASIGLTKNLTLEPFWLLEFRRNRGKLCNIGLIDDENNSWSMLSNVKAKLLLICVSSARVTGASASWSSSSRLLKI